MSNIRFLLLISVIEIVPNISSLFSQTLFISDLAISTSDRHDSLKIKFLGTTKSEITDSVVNRIFRLDHIILLMNNDTIEESKYQSIHFDRAFYSGRLDSLILISKPYFFKGYVQIDLAAYVEKSVREMYPWLFDWRGWVGSIVLGTVPLVNGIKKYSQTKSNYNIYYDTIRDPRASVYREYKNNPLDNLDLSGRTNYFTTLKKANNNAVFKISKGLLLICAEPLLHLFFKQKSKHGGTNKISFNMTPILEPISGSGIYLTAKYKF